jgi:hypothetical protein
MLFGFQQQRIILALGVPDECYSSNALCELNLISTFCFCFLNTIKGEPEINIFWIYKHMWNIKSKWNTNNKQESMVFCCMHDIFIFFLFSTIPN